MEGIAKAVASSNWRGGAPARVDTVRHSTATVICFLAIQSWSTIDPLSKITGPRPQTMQFEGTLWVPWGERVYCPYDASTHKKCDGSLELAGASAVGGKLLASTGSECSSGSSEKAVKHHLLIVQCGVPVSQLRIPGKDVGLLLHSV